LKLIEALQSSGEGEVALRLVLAAEARVQEETVEHLHLVVWVEGDHAETVVSVHLARLERKNEALLLPVELLEDDAILGQVDGHADQVLLLEGEALADIVELGLTAEAAAIRGDQVVAVIALVKEELKVVLSELRGLADPECKPLHFLAAVHAPHLKDHLADRQLELGL